MDEYVTWFWDLEFWHWWTFAIALIALEVFLTSTTLLLGPAAAAFIIGLILLIDPGFDWRYQMLLFAVLAVVSAISWQVWLRKHPTKTDHPMLNTTVVAGSRSTTHGGWPLPMAMKPWPRVQKSRFPIRMARRSLCAVSAILERRGPAETGR